MGPCLVLDASGAVGGDTRPWVPPTRCGRAGACRSGRRAPARAAQDRPGDTWTAFPRRSGRSRRRWSPRRSRLGVRLLGTDAPSVDALPPPIAAGPTRPAPHTACGSSRGWRSPVSPRAASTCSAYRCACATRTPRRCGRCCVRARERAGTARGRCRASTRSRCRAGIYLDGNSLGPLPTAAQAAIERRCGSGRSTACPPGTTGSASRSGSRRRWLGSSVRPRRGDRDGLDHHQPAPAARDAARGRPGRRDVLATALDFPTDLYALRAWAERGGGRLRLVPSRDGTPSRPSDVEAELAAGGVATMLLPVVLYRSGQRFDVARLTAAAHAVGAMALWDAAHSIGALPHALHDDGVDAAVWCSYKYLNAGPGGARRALPAPSATPSGPRPAGLVGPRQGEPVRDGADLHAGRRCRAPAAGHAADPVAGRPRGCAGDLRGGRDRARARALAGAHRRPAGARSRRRCPRCGS
jgi:hypothetical protein